ncbi:MAG: amidohydrolase family protein [Kiritimatiellae bacterium]|nr:amidohydrolase family protein [Kiritimatiellia bacterium]
MIKDVPGFVDLQINGYQGVDFSDAGLSAAGFAAACRGIFEAGTAAFLPTIVTSTLSTYEHNLPIIAQAMRLPEFEGRVLGVHLEGPFISPEDGARGAHPLPHVKAPDIQVLERLLGLSEGSIRMLTVAAELKGVDQLIAYATSQGISVSLGHQLAEDQAIHAAATAGAKCLTHLGNGVPATIDRHHNPIWAGLAQEELTAMIITDGHHLPASLIKLFLRIKGSAQVVVTSDGTALTNMLPGSYHMFGADVTLDESGRLYNPLTGYLAGSGSTMLQCMNYLASLQLLTLAELIQVGCANPLNLINAQPPPPGITLSYDEELRQFAL